MDAIQEQVYRDKVTTAVPKHIHKDEIRECARETKKQLINLTHDEMNNFCGNIIQLSNHKGESVVLMSERARRSY